METTTAVFERFAEVLDQPSNDGYARLQAQLLKRHHVCERLEQGSKPWRPHSAQCACRGAKRWLSDSQTPERLRVHIEAEHLAQRAPEASAGFGGRVTRSNGELNVGFGDRPPALHIDEHKTIRRREDPQVAVLLPDIDPIRRPPLQHAHSRLEMKGRVGAERRAPMRACLC